MGKKLNARDKQDLADIISELSAILAKAEKDQEVEVDLNGAVRTKVTTNEGAMLYPSGIVGRIC